MVERKGREIGWRRESKRERERERGWRGERGGAGQRE